jgi:endonuclease-3
LKNSCINNLLILLDDLYNEARCSLHLTTPWQLLAATILSAQCTDERVNQVTPGLFARFPDAIATSHASLEELENIIKACGFFHNKAKSILGAAAVLSKKYDGCVPNDLQLLIKLPGIGRKTANVILGNAFSIPGITVDTHVSRLARRLGLSAEKTPDKIEQDLMALIPREKWTKFSHQLIYHGRKVCKARKPLCKECELTELCEFTKYN